MTDFSASAKTFLLTGTLWSCLVAGTSATGDDVTEAGGSEYDVGVAAVDITPDYPIRLNGFGNRREESEGVSQPIFARALAISQGDQAPLVLITLDSLGVRTSMVDAVAKQLQQSHQLPRKNLAVTFTHSHCTPKVNGACDNIFSTAIPPEHQQHIDQYTRELTDYIIDVATKALNDRQPATLHWGVGEVTFAKNRRLVGGPRDHDLPMLVVRSVKDGKPRAIYVSYACHCVTLGFNQISGDWAGYAAAMIERNLPGTVAMVSIGAGSDQNPISGVTPDKVDVAEGQGVEIATEVQRLLGTELRAITGSAKSVLNTIALPLNDVPTREELEQRLTKGRPTDQYNATTQLAKLDRGEALLSQIDYPIQTWTFGDSFCMTFLAGEVCVDYALRLKQELDRNRFWLNTYSNDFCCYIPSERLVAEGGYGGGAEVPYFALPTTLKGGLETLIVEEVHRQVPDEFHSAQGTQGVPPKSPAESLKCMQTHNNLHIALAAAEPDVTDPVAIDFGVDGRLWVAEMNDYGEGVFETFPQNGRIRWLRDSDSDGEFEEAHTFVDGLRFPTDVKVWRNGVLICDAPDILYAQDTNGDGRADNVEKLFSGFDVRNAQARVNSLRFGLDNWVYGSGGLFGGIITSVKTGETVDCSNRDFRLNPDTGVIQAVSGRTQQGRDRNDIGDWFGCSNGALLRAIPGDDDYTSGDRATAPSTPMNVSAPADTYRLFPPDNLVTFELSGAPGSATAACGLGIYRDVALGRDYRGDAFTCEPVHQSVHRIDLDFQEHGYVGRRGAGEEASEFLSSTDRWFRPVQARTGPDGALWVVDMYRYVIEHSRWIPQATLAEVDVRAGRGKGRIYRVSSSTSQKANRMRLIPDLASLSPTDRVQQLDTANGVIRDLVHQMILWESPARVAEALRTLLTTARHPIAKIHAVSLLHHADLLQPEDLMPLLDSEYDHIVRLAVKFSETLLSRPLESRSLPDAVANLDSHDNPRVRRQAALSLGACNAPDTGLYLARLLVDEPDVHVRSAVFSSINARNIASIIDVFPTQSKDPQNLRSGERLVVMAIQLGENSVVERVLSELPSVTALPTGPAMNHWIDVISALDSRQHRHSVAPGSRFVQSMTAIRTAALQKAQQISATEPELLAAIRLLGRPFGPFAKSALSKEQQRTFVTQNVEALAGLLSPRYPANIQQAAIEGIAATAAPNASEVLINACGSLNSDSQAAVVDALLNHQGGATALLDAISAQQLRPEIFDAASRQRALTSPDEGVRILAARVFGMERQSSRASVIETLQSALQLPADVNHGRDVFRKRCASCHKLEDHGFVVGPDLKALTNRDPQWLLTTILDPNKDVDARYTAWTAAMNDGRTASGMIVEETATTILLRESGGKEHLLVRTDIDEFRSTQKSVMPEGLEKDLSPQDLRNVIAYVTSMAPARTGHSTPAGDGELPRQPPEIAPFLLDETQSAERRQAVIDARPGMGPGIVSILVSDLPPGDLDEEYRRIPWIWRVAIATAKRNDGGEIRDLLEVSVSGEGHPLKDWQAVVIGGGLINGLTQIGVWPHQRIAEILSGLPGVKAAWPQLLQKSALMADDTSVRNGTRYDALRIVALQDEAIAVPFLKKYFTPDTNSELQMGAVSGLCDIDSDTVIPLLIDSLSFLEGPNRRLAIEGLLRTDARATALTQQIQSKKITLTEADVAILQQQTNEASRVRAKRLQQTLQP
ncbi:MAG: neutral/alkaline non-lysosomal ceramidase N-terminal domain-containing protein [Planctomycetaceae bacterium]